MESVIKTIEIVPDCVRLLNQRKLPLVEEYLECRTYQEVAEAIKTLVVLRSSHWCGCGCRHCPGHAATRSHAGGKCQRAVRAYLYCHVPNTPHRGQPLLGHCAHAGVCRTILPRPPGRVAAGFTDG